MSKFPTRLKELREKRELLGKDLAKIICVEPATITNWEKGNRFPKDDMLIKIADYFDCSLDYLLGRDDDHLENIYTEDSHDQTNELKTIKVVDKNLHNIINEEKENTNNSELEITELYNKYFSDLFKLKTINMSPHDYFKFILSLCPLTEINHLTEEDLNELSVLFYRFLTLKVHERNVILKNL